MLRRLAGGAAAVRSPAAAALRRMLHISGGGGCGSREPESVAYRMSMLRRPSSVGKKGLTWNSCSLIGRLDAPVTPFDGSCDEDPGAYTFLSVSPSSSAASSSPSSFSLLGSYHRVSPSGERYICYKIHVTELNYVLDQNKKPQDGEDKVHPPPNLSATPQMLKEKRYIDRLHLWQVFFANPYEWWDNRQSKPWANYPDFKHKDTREKIWLRPDDPPWVRKQLELHDLEVAENGHKGNGRLLKNHNWKAQDFDYSDDEEVQHSAEA